MTKTISSQLNVCTVSTCGRFFNPSIAGFDATGRCLGCRTRGNKPAVRIDAEASVPGIVREKQAPTPVKWADESNGVCNRCSGSGLKFGGDCFRCGGSGVAPNYKASIAREVEATVVFEEVILDLGDDEEAPYVRPAFLRTPDPIAAAIAQDERKSKRFGQLTAVQQAIVLNRARFLVSRRGLTNAAGWQVSTPIFARRADGGFDVIPF